MKVCRPYPIPAIEQMLLCQLLQAINLYTEKLGSGGDARIADLTPETIPLHRDDFAYKSAIAFKLSAILHLPALDIATHIAACLPTSNQYSAEQLVLEFTIEVVTPGWIYFHLTHQGIAAWLQHLTMTPPTPENLQLFGMKIPRPEHLDDDTASLFPVQYAHARCCSLLRLGHWQGTIRLSTHPNPQVLQLIEPNPIPWLNAEGQLYLVHPNERRLICQLLGLLDELGDSSQASISARTLLKLAGSLSDAMTSFYASCRIWGEVKTQTPNLSQARLGLVGVTRSLLRLMLQDVLKAAAPVEL